MSTIINGVAFKYAVGDKLFVAECWRTTLPISFATVSRLVEWGDGYPRYGLVELDERMGNAEHSLPESSLIAIGNGTGHSSVAGGSTAPNTLSQWQLSRSLSMRDGECVCGIARRNCDYHH